MRKTTALISTAALILGFGAAAFAAPQGMAPYPGQNNAYVAPPPPPGDGAMAPQPGAEAPRKRSGCAWTRRIDNWTPVDDRTMIVSQGSKRFLVTFNGRCHAQKFENAMRVTRHWGSCLSPGDTMEFVSPSGFGRPHIYDSCVVSKVEIAPERTAQR